MKNRKEKGWKSRMQIELEEKLKDEKEKVSESEFNVNLVFDSNTFIFIHIIHCRRFDC